MFYFSKAISVKKILIKKIKNKDRKVYAFSLYLILNIFIFVFDNYEMIENIQIIHLVLPSFLKLEKDFVLRLNSPLLQP